jgi:hypothetical protein
VTLQRKLAGQTSFHAVGTDHSSTNGTWEVTSGPVANAKYRAVVNSKRLGDNTCKATVSSETTARNTNTTIVQGASNFHGKVSSPADGCVPNRHVALQRKGIYQSTFNTVGDDDTAANGAWIVPVTPTPGASYRAFVSAKQVGPNSCMKRISQTVVAS